MIHLPQELKVLLVEDSENDEILVTHELEKGTARPIVHRVETEKELRKALDGQTFDIVISDYILPKFGGLEALKIVREKNEYLPFVLVSGKIGEEVAVEMMRLGANDYVMKGSLTKLNQVIKRELADSKIKFEGAKAKEDLRKSYEELKVNAQRLEEANRRSQAEAEERRKAQAEALRAKEFLDNVIDSASDLVISFDRTNRVATWNKVAQTLTGYSSKEVLNRGIEKVGVFANPEEIGSLLKGIYATGLTRNNEFTLRTKNNAKKIIRARGSVIRGPDDKEIGVMFLGADITPELEAHGKLIDGMSYLVRERNISAPIDLMSNLVRSGYSGMLITRTNRDIIASLVPPSLGIKVIFLRNEPSKDGMNEVVGSIRGFTSSSEKSVILLDGIHYLITKYGFDGFLKILFEINDGAYQNRNILLVRVDPGILDEQRMAMLENELYLLPSQKIEDIIIDDDIYGLLRYVSDENQNNAIVSIKKVMAKFQISFVTAAKRVEALEKDGLLFVKKQGKLRSPYITEKGKTLLQKRRVG